MKTKLYLTFIAISFLISSCFQTLPTPLPPGQIGETPSLTGQAANWINRALSIKLELQKGTGTTATLEYLSAGSIDAAGNFSIVLPDKTTMNPFLQTAKNFFPSTVCPRVEIIPDDLRDSNAAIIAVFDGSTLIGRLSLEPSVFSNVGDVFAALIFFDKAAELNVDCAGSINNHLHTRVGLGWNFDISEMYAPNLAHEYVDNLPKKIKWTYAGVTPSNLIGVSGGTASFENNSINLTVPEGALSRDTLITNMPVSTGLPTNYEVIAGSSFELLPKDLQFAKPAELNLKFDATTLPAGVGVDDLSLGYVKDGQWVLLPTTISAITVAANTRITRAPNQPNYSFKAPIDYSVIYAIIRKALTSAPTINSFTVTPDYGYDTVNVTLAWNVSGASKVEINPGIGTVTASGSQVVSVSSSTTFYLYAQNSIGNRTKTLTVDIEQTPANALKITPETLNGLLSERFTWKDNENKDRSMVLIHSDQANSKGGYMNQFTYTLPDNSVRTINEQPFTNGAGGFGYIVSHLKDASLAGNGEDDSPLGSTLNNAWRVVWKGNHHAILEYTLNYPRWGKNAAGVTTKYDMPVTVHWLVSSGNRYPLWSVTMDLSAAPDGAVVADVRAPYGDMDFSGGTNGGATLAGVAWGDSNHFKSTSTPFTMNSNWDWTLPNTSAAYNLLYAPGATSDSDAEMGIVGTRVIGKQDAGGYEGQVGRGLSAPTTNPTCGGIQHRMPCQWSFQSVYDSFYNAGQYATNITTQDKRLAWGADYGYLGGSTYTSSNNAGAMISGSFPKRSYSTWIVLDPHSTQPTQLLADQASVIDTTIFQVAGFGKRRDQGAKGVADATLETYSPPGFNHVYSTWEADWGTKTDGSTTPGIGTVFNVPTGKTLVRPSIVVNDYPKNISPKTVNFITTNPVTSTLLQANIDYFSSVNPTTHQLWLTLNRDLTDRKGLEIIP